jgi:hypothetical protein
MNIPKNNGFINSMLCLLKYSGKEKIFKNGGEKTGILLIVNSF